MIRSFAYELAWFAVLVPLLYSIIMYSFELGLSKPIQFLVMCVVVVTLAVLRQVADNAFGLGRGE